MKMITTKLTIEALNLAEVAHRGQTDKTEAAYILHPITVASQMEDEISTCVALLHDVLEDTDITESVLINKFPEQVVDAVVALTRRHRESYAEYILRVKQNDIARKVKIADLTHNLQEDRLAILNRGLAGDAERVEGLRKRYEKALKELLADDSLCERCRNCAVNGLSLVCRASAENFDERQKLEENPPHCESYECRFIQYPLTINAIKREGFDCGSLYECGQLVSVRPVGDEKTYLGILLGELMYYTNVSFRKESRALTLSPMTNPAIYVPALKKIVFGYESWWSRITSEDDLKDITDEDINEQWYVKLLKEITGKEETQE